MKLAAAQHWDALSYGENARFVADLGEPLLEMLAPRAGESILDLGCGDGAFTRKLAASGARVIGVDQAPSFVEAARAAGIDARLMDGESLTFFREFDAVVSNAAMHWMLRPDAVLDGISRALKPGGRLVTEFGGHGNVAAITVALFAVLRRHAGGQAVRSPWYFPTAEEYAVKLQQHGFTVHAIALVPRPTALPTGMEKWLELFARPFLGWLPPADQIAARAEVVELLRPALCTADGRWIADYVRLRVHATAPS